MASCTTTIAPSIGGSATSVTRRTLSRQAPPQRFEFLVAIELDRQPSAVLEPGEDDLRAQRPAKFLLERPGLWIGHDLPPLPGARLGGACAHPVFRLPDAPMLPDD